MTSNTKEEDIIPMVNIKLDTNECVLCRKEDIWTVLSCCNTKVCKKCYKSISKILKESKTCPYCEKDCSQLPDPNPNFFERNGCPEIMDVYRNKRLLKWLFIFLFVWFMIHYILWILLNNFSIYRHNILRIFVYSLWNALLSSIFMFLIIFAIFVIIRMIWNRSNR